MNKNKRQSIWEVTIQGLLIIRLTSVCRPQGGGCVFECYFYQYMASKILRLHSSFSKISYERSNHNYPILQLPESSSHSHRQFYPVTLFKLSCLICLGSSFSSVQNHHSLSTSLTISWIFCFWITLFIFFSRFQFQPCNLLH